MQADVGKGRNTVKDKRMTEKRCSRQEVDSMDIYFLRHGETKWNTRGRIQGQKNTRLSEKGLEQARLTAEGMKDIPFDIIYSSPLERAYETAQIVRGERNIPIIRDDRLKEISFGADEGRHINRILANPAFTRKQRYFNDPVHYRGAKGGESFRDVNKRIWSFVEEILLPLEGHKSCVLVTAHVNVIRSFIQQLNHRPLEAFKKTTFQQNCAVAKFHCENGTFAMDFESKVYYEE